MRRLRHWFWQQLGSAFSWASRFCFKRRAALCPGPCFFCHLILNGDKIAAQAVADAIRVANGGTPVDRRPS